MLLAITKLNGLVFLGVFDGFKISKLCKKCPCIYTDNDAITDYLCGNRIEELAPCGAPLIDAHTTPYRMITTYIKEPITDYGAENLKKL